MNIAKRKSFSISFPIFFIFFWSEYREKEKSGGGRRIIEILFQYVET